MTPPATLDRDGIAARIPHSGGMCLLDRLRAWTAAGIHCGTSSHADPANPLRSQAGLLAPCAIEYAAQAMALHGSLVAAGAGLHTAPTAGYLASVRNVEFQVSRLDLVPGELQVHAERLSGDARQVLYAFALKDAAGAPLARGRAVVVLDTPLPPAPAAIREARA